MRNLIVGLLALTACGTAAPPAAPPAASPPEATAPLGRPASVEVPMGGKRFEPAVSSAQIPEGAWYCDMGTVHYARMHEGDGECPVCGMALVQAGEKVGADGKSDH